MNAPRFRSSVRVLTGGILALCSAAVSVEARAQQGTSALVVTVTSHGSGRPVMGARVSIVGTQIAATTDAAGRLRMAGLPTGTQTVEVRRLGYATRLKLVNLQPGQSTPVSFDLEVEAIPVAAIRVEGKRLRDWGAEYLERSGFDRRRKTGLGSFITRAELERRNPSFLSDALRAVPGINFQPNTMRGDAYVSMVRAGRPCPIQYFVDGQLIGPGFNIDEIAAGDVEGLEIYRGASQVPPEFNRRTASCGVIAVWTRPR